MRISKDVELEPGYTWSMTTITGPYSIKDKFKAFMRPFTNQETNYFEILNKTKASIWEKCSFAILNCIKPLLDPDKVLPGVQYTLLNSVLHVSGYTTDNSYQFKGSTSIVDKFDNWANSKECLEQTLCLSVFPNYTYANLEAVDPLQNHKILHGTLERWRVLFGQEAYEQILPLIYPEIEVGVGIKENTRVDHLPGATKYDAGVERTTTVIKAKSAPKVSIQEMKELIKSGKMEAPNFDPRYGDPRFGPIKRP